MLPGPILSLIDGQCLPVGLWVELPTGVLCKLYRAEDYVWGYLDYRLICSSTQQSPGGDLSTEVDGIRVELEHGEQWCLLTITGYELITDTRDAMDAGAT